AIRLVFYRVSCPPGLLGCGSKEVREHDPPESGVPAPTLTSRAIAREDRMRVVIGVDPHKGSHMAVAIDANEQQLAMVQVRSGPASARGVARLGGVDVAAPDVADEAGVWNRFESLQRGL